MAGEYITAIGIRPREDSIGPPGHHLRWAFPDHLGFPAKGFVVHRRRSGGFKPDHCLNLKKEKVPTGTIVAPGATLESVTFVYPDAIEVRGNGENLTITPPGTGLLELRFVEPVAFLRIDVQGIQGPVQLRAYAGSSLVASSATSTSGNRSLQVAAPYVTRATIPLNFTRLAEICHLSTQAACADASWGQPIAELPLIGSVDKGLARLEVKLQNRYAKSRDLAVKRYEPELKGLIEWLQLLQDPTSTAFSNPGAAPDQLRLPAPTDGPLQSVRPQPVLLLAALDPNIARFLSLYWVDQFGTPNGPTDGTAYDYKITGQWKSGGAGCGLVLGLGKEKAALPSVEKPIEGNQLPGLRWQGKTPLGRVGLRWPRPADQREVQPVLFDLRRNPGTGKEQFLTEKLPVLVPTKAWTDHDKTALFIDPVVPVGKHAYGLQGIDLFGQAGPLIESEPVLVEDLVAPPPPIRLRASLRQPGYPWRTEAQLAELANPATLTVQFEYGDAQHRQAPDARAFRIYWRADSMFESMTAVVQRVSSQVLDNGTTVHAVRLPGAAAADLAAFASGKLSRVSATADALSAAERKHYQIAKLLPTGNLQLAPSDSPFVDGSYRLVSDPRSRSNWHQLGFTIGVRAPLQGLLLDTAPLQASVTDVATLTPRQGPLARPRRSPAARRSGMPAGSHCRGAQPAACRSTWMPCSRKRRPAAPRPRSLCMPRRWLSSADFGTACACRWWPIACVCGASIRCWSRDIFIRSCVTGRRAGGRPAPCWFLAAQSLDAEHAHALQRGDLLPSAQGEIGVYAAGRGPAFRALAGATTPELLHRVVAPHLELYLLRTASGGVTGLWLRSPESLDLRLDVRDTNGNLTGKHVGRSTRRRDCSARMIYRSASCGSTCNIQCPLEVEPL